jgi:hypothetical protein
MARWRLINPHYLHVPGTEWEYKETDRSSGKQGRKIFAVPLYLDPRDNADHNYPGEIIVCDKESPVYPKDILFQSARGLRGEPTPEMEPLDDEAVQISRALEHKWVHPIESLPTHATASQIPDVVVAPKPQPKPLARRV